MSADDLRTLLSGPLGGDTSRIGSVRLRDSHAYVRLPEEQVDAVMSGMHGTQTRAVTSLRVSFRPCYCRQRSVSMRGHIARCTSVGILAISCAACGRLGFGPDDGAADGSDSDAAGAPSGNLDATRCDEITATYLCDGMENSALVAWDGNDAGNGETIARDTDVKYRGLASVRSETTLNSGSTALYRAAFPSLVSGELYMRTYVYVPAASATNDTVIINATASDMFRAQSGLLIEPDSSIVFRVASADIRVGGVGGTIARDRWVCAEAHLTISDVAGTAEFWIDGELFGTRTNIDTLPTGGYTHLLAGLSWTAVATRVYVDEVIASSERIGCD